MADADAASPEQGFEILGDETRRQIILALADRLKEAPEDPTIGFADLRRRVGVRDSGNFNYHLEKLTGRFVTKTDEGYRIGPAGVEVVTALITGVYGEKASLGPVELDDPCPECNDLLTATYDNGLLRVACPNEHVFRNTLPPGVIDDRTLGEVIELLTLTTRHDLELAIEQICPFCYARLDWAVDVDSISTSAEVETQCSRCGVRIGIPVIVSLLRHPTVASFYHEHDVDVRTSPLWAAEFFRSVTIRTSTDPDRIHVRIDFEGETIEATLDDSLSVVEITS